MWVDRLRRRPILIATDLLRALSLLSIPAAVLVDALTIWQLYGVVLLNGCLTVFFDIASQSYLPSVVDGSRLVDANAKLELSRTTSQRLGPGLAGVLIGALTAPFAVVIDALSYGLSAALLSLVRSTESGARPASGEEATLAPPASMRGDVAVGLRFVAAQPWLRAMALTVAIEYLFSTIADAILILHLVTERGFTAGEVGFAFTIGSIGVIGGALAAPRLTQRLGVGPMLIVAAIGSSVSWLPVAAAPDELLFAGLTTTIVALGLFGAFWTVNAVSLRQAVTPGPMLGRVTATMRFIGWGLIPVGSILGGLLGEVIGLREAIWVGALGTMLACVPVLLSPLRHLREIPESTATTA